MNTKEQDYAIRDALASLHRQLIERAGDDAGTPLLLTMGRAKVLCDAFTDAATAPLLARIAELEAELARPSYNSSLMVQTTVTVKTGRRKYPLSALDSRRHQPSRMRIESVNSLRPQGTARRRCNPLPVRSRDGQAQKKQAGTAYAIQLSRDCSGGHQPSRMRTGGQCRSLGMKSRSGLQTNVDGPSTRRTRSE